jgi:hypothetical protein
MKKRANLINKSGYLFEKKVSEKLEELGLRHKAQAKLGLTPFSKPRRADFAVFLEDTTLVIECKRQTVRGTAEEKIVYTMLSLSKLHEEYTNAIPILVMEGGGWSKGCIEWAKRNAKDYGVLLMSVNQLVEYLEEVTDNE